jgi:ribonuclease BN (tRNA processing enzyme)
MELVTVGTGTVAPSARRTCPSHWVARGDLRLLLDCGSGTLHRLAEFGLPWQQVTHVILTHFHPDHWGELPMLVYALKYTAQPARSEPFPLNADVNLETFPVPHTDESVALSLTSPEGRLVYTGDTGPSSELARWATGCDLLLAECSLPESMAMDIHLTPERAGDLAKEAAAKRLVLTHFYPPVETSDPAKLAGKRFGGPVTAAQDGDRFTIGDGGGGGRR